MCLYVYDIQANMHLIQLLCERRYMQIHQDTCIYINVCITYTSCICDIDCVISCAYVVHMQTVCQSHTCTYINPYVCFMCFRYIHICIGRITDGGTKPRDSEARGRTAPGATAAASIGRLSAHLNRLTARVGCRWIRTPCAALRARVEPMRQSGPKGLRGPWA